MHAEFEQHRDETGFARHIVRPDQAPLGVRLLQEGLGSLRGAIGTPAQVEDLVSRYEKAGVDQVIFVLQAGNNRHEHVCESLELFAEQVMPRFVEGREEREHEKAQRLAPAIERALARRPPPRKATSGYVIDEAAELARSRRSRRRAAPGARQLAALAASSVRRTAREQVTRMLARTVEGASDEEVERRFGSGLIQRAMFTAMAQAFEPDAAAGFQGTLVYELARPSTNAHPTHWTIQVSNGSASARQGASQDPALTIRFNLADFVRIAAGTVDPAQPLLEDRASFEGDFALAVRLPEMFGAPSPY